MSQIAGKSVSIQIPSADLDFLSNNGFISIIQKDDYDRESAEVSVLTEMNNDLNYEVTEERTAAANLSEEEKKTHSIMFHLEGKEKQQVQLDNEAKEKTIVTNEEKEIVEKEAKVNQLIQKKSKIDRMVPYNDRYLCLTGMGVVTLNDLNVRNYRVCDTELSNFIQECKAAADEMRIMAEKGSFHASRLRPIFPDTEFSQIWRASLGLAKVQGESDLINQRFLVAFGILRNFECTIENKMMAAEIMTDSMANPSQSSDNSDLQNISETLSSIDHVLKSEDKVPKELSAGVATVILYGKRSDGTYPIERFKEFSKITPSYESAAILSIRNVPSEQLVIKFQAYNSLFHSWGFRLSEDTELASAYLAVSDLEPDDVKTKMTIIIDALKNYLEYPLVAAAILTSIPTLEANETLDMMEKAYSQLWSFANCLQRSELISLSVLMIHGVESDLVRKLDSTAKVAASLAPAPDTNIPSNVFFLSRMPLIISHSSYYSTYSGIGGFHPAHVHGFWGFSG